jgi:hypothetical protein
LIHAERVQDVLLDIVDKGYSRESRDDGRNDKVVTVTVLVGGAEGSRGAECSE